MAAGYKVQGIDQMNAKLRRLKAANATEAKEAVFEGGHHVLGVARSRAPHEEGDLERSGEVSTDTEGTTAVVSFDTPYAVRQHEDMTYSHDEGRTAKYLERSMVSEAPKVTAIVVTHLNNVYR